jgi:hypothetical protein
MPETNRPADGLLHALEKSDAALALVDQRLMREGTEAFTGPHARLNPVRLLKRLEALEAELPRLKEAARRNAAAKREILGALHAQQCSAQTEVLELARLACADVHEDEESWRDAEHVARSSLARNISAADEAAAANATLPAPAPESRHRPTPPSSCGSPAPAAAIDAQPPIPAAAAAAAPSPPETLPQAVPPALGVPVTSPMEISEPSWLRLSGTVRGEVSLKDLNAFWAVLRSLFARRETRELAAAQLLALGVRMSEQNARYMRILEALGLLKLQNNAVTLI